LKIIFTSGQLKLSFYNKKWDLIEYFLFYSRCQYSDSISAFVFVNGKKVKVLEHCGPNPPPDMMSHDHRMTLEFNAKASATPSGRGFYALYAFVSGMEHIKIGCDFFATV
jgi:hypothetical protein